MHGKTSLFAFLLLLLPILPIQKEASGATFDYVPRPEFVESSSELNVTSYLSQTSRIPCRVRHLGNKKVSWIRERDLQVISSGRTKFITDIRISILPGSSSSKRFEKRNAKRIIGRSFVAANEPHFSNRTNVPDPNQFRDELWLPDKSTKATISYREKRNSNRRKLIRSSGYDCSRSKSDHSHSNHARYDRYYDEGVVRRMTGQHHTPHRKKSKKSVRENKYEINEDNTFYYDYLSDIFTEKYKKTINESSSYKTYRIDSLPSSSSSSSSSSSASSSSSSSLSSPYYTSPSKGIKSYFKKHSSKDSTRRNLRQQNDILISDERNHNKKRKAKQNLKNPIFIRPLSNSNNFNDNSVAKQIHVPYNYLDAFWEPEDFTLQIKYTRTSDAGTYLCQINTEPRMTQLIRLRTVEMVAKIEGPDELFVKEGSPVILTCRITHGDNLPGFIFWYKDDILVDYDSTKGRVEVDMSLNGQSQLILKEVVGEDSANYTCSPSGGKADSVMLTVIEDKRPEAVQQSNKSTSNFKANRRISLLISGIVVVATMLQNRKIILFSSS